MINPENLREHVVKPVLSALGAYDARMNTPAAVELLLGTSAQESDGGYHLTQLGGGPGLGIYQIEPATHKDVWRYLDREDRHELREIIRGLSHDYSDKALIYNLYYATAIARIRYWYEAEPLPEDREGQARYWDVHFNANGEDQVDEYLDSYQRFVSDG